jgi:hypothetical protein
VGGEGGSWFYEYEEAAAKGTWWRWWWGSLSGEAGPTAGVVTTGAKAELDH